MHFSKVFVILYTNICTTVFWKEYKNGNYKRNAEKDIRVFAWKVAENGRSPSVREIGAAVGLRSTSSVQANLNALEDAGYISRDPLLKRSIRLNIKEEAKQITEVPLVGTVTAGAPILAVEQVEGYIPYGGKRFLGQVAFCSSRKGRKYDKRRNSWRWHNCCRADPEARNGDKVVALIDDEATVKLSIGKRIISDSSLKTITWILLSVTNLLSSEE